MRLFDPRTGRLETFRPAAPPKVRFARSRASSPRLETFVAGFQSALVYLGYAPEAAPEPIDVFIGADPPPSGAAWLKVAGGGRASGRWQMLRTHYRARLDASPAALAESSAELEALRQAARRLRGSAAGSPSGVAGYKKKFRDALSNDLDFPGLVAGLWDALRPGALSPGSQREILMEADAIFGHIFSSEPSSKFTGS